MTQPRSGSGSSRCRSTRYRRTVNPSWSISFDVSFDVFGQDRYECGLRWLVRLKHRRPPYLDVLVGLTENSAVTSSVHVDGNAAQTCSPRVWTCVLPYRQKCSLRPCCHAALSSGSW